MIYIVVKHIEGDHIREIFRSQNFEEASQYLINDFKEYCKLHDIEYMERNFDDPDAEIDNPYDYDGVYEKNSADAFDDFVGISCFWDVIDV